MYSQCHIQSCFEAGIPVWDPKLRPPNAQKCWFESHVLSYSERKIAKNFQGFTLGPHWGGLTAPTQTPQLHNGFSPRYACQKTGTPKKLLDMALIPHVKYIWQSLLIMVDFDALSSLWFPPWSSCFEASCLRVIAEVLKFSRLNSLLWSIQFENICLSFSWKRLSA